MTRFLLAAFLALFGFGGAFAQTPGQGGNVPNTPPAIGIGQPIGQKTISTFPVTSAVGDGVTDDSAVIQAQITVANSAGGGRVILTVGKTYAIASALSMLGAPNVSLECSASGLAIIAPGPCALKWTGSANSFTTGTVSAAGTGYVPGDTITLSGGTSSMAGVVQVETTKVVSASAGTNGIGCTNGTYTVTLTTGSVGAGALATINVTMASNVPTVNSITTGGSYVANPANIAQEPVTGVAGCSTQPKLAVVMGVNTITTIVPGLYTVLPSNPVAQNTTTGSGVNATMTMTTGGTMMLISPAAAANAETVGNQVNGISFLCDGSGAAAYGLVLQSYRQIEMDGNYFQHCSTAAFFPTQVALTGTTATSQNSTFKNLSFLQSLSTDGNCIREMNANSYNNSLNTYITGFCQYYTHGLYIRGSDNQTFINYHETRAGGGTGAGVFLTGSPLFTANSNRFFSLSAGAGGTTLAGTDTIALATFNNMFVGYDVANSIPLPTIGTGATYTVINEKGLVYGNFVPIGPMGIQAAANINAAFTYLAANQGEAGLYAWSIFALVNATTSCHLGIDANSNFQLAAHANCGVANFSGMGWQDKLRKITSGSSDTGGFNDNIISWASGSGAAKAQSIPGCNGASRLGAKFVIKDQQGDAATNNITVTPTSGTIDGAATAVINTNKGFLRMNCDGGTNYVLN
jgi:hypothetical protein